jgi:2,4-dienoyl-CoA reductase-like NADH-dependent reductase (Old Yellow Enzyme family)
MKKLFEHNSINGMSLNNRFVRSATWEGLADSNGAVTKKLIEMMVDLAKGEVGLIISGYTFVSPEGKSNPGQMAVYDDRFLPGLRDMAQAVHAAGGKIALQIVHGGAFANPELTGLKTMGPSDGEQQGHPTCRPMTQDDIADILSAFTRAALRAKQAGFDAIEFSGGTVASPEALMPPRPGVLKSPENEVYYRESANLYKQKVQIPLMLVGGIRSYKVADVLV